MKSGLNILLLLLLVTVAGILPAQKPLIDTGFRSPVDFPVTLSGAFGEIRRNHFHSGIDIRTGGTEGKPVYAIADGYVSRVNISSVGFGKALYITHPNGYTSVYAHLKKFTGPIASWVEKTQYEKESFSMDTEVLPGILKVKKGEMIALSGNSGSSGGPHIHFEIRDTKTQEILDPLDFGFMKSDRLAPIIRFVKIYPHDDRSMVNFRNQPLLTQTVGSSGKYRLKGHDTVHVTGSIIFGIETNDAGEGSLKTGVHKIRLFLDNKLVFSQDIDRFAFSETRYVNSILDYPAYVKDGRKIQRSYLAPNNKTGIVKLAENRGILSFSSAGFHAVRYEAEDAFGHQSVVSFTLKSHPPAPAGARPATSGSPAENPEGKLITWKNDNLYERKEMKLEIPKEAVYEDFYFSFNELAPPVEAKSPLFQIHDRNTPLHTYCQLSIRLSSVPDKLTGKAVIASVGANGKFSSVGGKFTGGWITARIREFGKFTVVLDTRPPIITPVNISQHKNVQKQRTIRMKISDDLSGIDTYRGTLNGKWILMDYDAKNRLLEYSFDHRLRPGRNEFRLVVTDAVGNSSVYSATLIR